MCSTMRFDNTDVDCDTLDEIIVLDHGDCEMSTKKTVRKHPT
jgi:hypothetical protein